MHISEPFMWFALRMLEPVDAIRDFVERGGIQVFCQSLVRSTRVQVHTHPGLVSIIMQHMHRTAASHSRHGSNCSSSTTAIGGSSGSGSNGGAGSTAIGGAGNTATNGATSMANNLQTAHGLVHTMIANATAAAAVSVPTAGTGGVCKKLPPPASLATMAHGNEGLINFAPYCTIFAESASAQSPDVLIQPPMSSHRRARTAAWTYLFYPNESYIDLHLTLPTAVLLREVQLQPHTTSLVTSPSAVALEVNRDANHHAPLPLSHPMSTVGLACIRLRLGQPEIASNLVVRLYRPKDSNNIGLSQIAVLGSTVFSRMATSLPPYTSFGTAGHAMSPCDAGDFLGASSGWCGDGGGASAGGIGEPETAVRSSLDWVRLATQCLTVVPDENGFCVQPCGDAQLPERIVNEMAVYPGFMEALCALMNANASGAEYSLQNVEKVLLVLGLRNRSLGLRLIGHLLRGTQSQTFRRCNSDVGDLLFGLCTARDEALGGRLAAALGWLEEFYRSGTSLRANPNSGFVRCLASILWHVYATETCSTVSYREAERLREEQRCGSVHCTDLTALIGEPLLRLVLQWSGELRGERGGGSTAVQLAQPLKQSVDALLCALCYIRPDMYTRLLRDVGVLVDGGGQQQHQPSQRHHQASITDDCKQLDDRQAATAHTDNWTLAATAQMVLNTAQLRSLAMASQSPPAIRRLLDSGLPLRCSQLVLEFVQRNGGPQQQQQRVRIDPMQPCTSSTAAAAAASADAPDANSYADLPATHAMFNTETVAELLDFFSECCAEGAMRDWLGSPAGSRFWSPLLHLLCNNNNNNDNHFASQSNPAQSHLAKLQTACVRFLTRVTAGHPPNQERLSEILIEVIGAALQPANGGGGGMLAVDKHLSGFTRRLVLQLLLESDRVLISVTSRDLDMMQSGESNALGGGCFSADCSNFASKAHSSGATPKLCVGNRCGALQPPPTLVRPNVMHPSVRCSRTEQLFQVSTHAQAGDILNACYDNDLFGPIQLWTGPEGESPERPAERRMTTTASTSTHQQRPMAHLPMPDGIIDMGMPSWTEMDWMPQTAATSTAANNGIKVQNNSSNTATQKFSKDVLEFTGEYLSVAAAGATAKDKRHKDEKNSQAAAALRNACQARGDIAGMLSSSHKGE